MSATDLEQKDERGSLVGLMESIRRLRSAPTARQRLFTKKEAARRLGVSAQRMRQLLFLGRLTIIRVGGSELIFL